MRLLETKVRNRFTTLDLLNHLGRLGVVLAGLLAGPAGAQSSGSADSSGSPLWEVGFAAFGLTQQAWPGASEEVQRAIALPYVLYRGPLLRIDREAFGLRAVKTSNFELDIGFSGSLGSRPGDTEARRGMPELGTLVEFGPRARWNLGSAPGGGQWRLDVPLRGVFDLNDSFASRGLALEPRIQWNHRDLAGWRLSTNVGALLGDRQLAGTFYDVGGAYATLARPAYEAKAGLIAWRLGVSGAHRLTRDWRIFGFARLDSVAGAANTDSPLVSRTTGYRAGIGLQWIWMRSERSAID
jgi:outer membrane scaffolding protein for murein synthesis (MipA/OmpV family)